MTVQELEISGGKSIGAFLELMKLRLCTLVLFTTAAGFYLAAPAAMDYILLLHVLVGVGLVAAGGAILNQYMEADADAKMDRTKNRPIPTGRVKPIEAQLFGVLCGIAGIAWLLGTTNLLAVFLCTLNLAIYVFVYTPLKKQNFNEHIGWSDCWCSGPDDWMGCGCR